MEMENIKVGMRVMFEREDAPNIWLGCEVTALNGDTVEVKNLTPRLSVDDPRPGAIFNVAASVLVRDHMEDVEEGMLHGVDSNERPCLVNVLTGERTYGAPGESTEEIFERLAL